MSNRTITRIAVVLLVAAVVLTIGGVWWWALLGMTEEVGTALTATALMLGALGALTLAGVAL